MIVEINKQKAGNFMSVESDVNCVKIRNNGGEIVAVAVQLDSGLFVTTAEDPKFVETCLQYGIPVKRPQVIKEI